MEERVSERKKLREKKMVSQFTFRCRIFVEEKVSKGKKLRERKKLLISQFMFTVRILWKKEFQTVKS